MNVSTGKVARPQKVVVYGPEGIGKTTLASAFPNPLFIDTEGGTHHFDVRRAEPAPSSWTMLVGYVAEVAAAGPGLCSTLVVDTADWAELMCIEHVCARQNIKGIEDLGYGKGYTYVKEEFARLLDKLGDCIAAGVNVVVCAHAQIRKFEQPDELGTYDRWELKLSKQCAPMLKEWADMVLFCNYETIIVKPDKKDGGHAKAAGGKRVMYATHNAAWDAKNRCGLPDKMPMEFAQIAAHVPAQPAPAAEPAADLSAHAESQAYLHEIARGNLAAEPPAAVSGSQPAAPAPASPSPAQAAPRRVDAVNARTRFVEVEPEPPADHLKPLRDLMELNGITEADLQNYCGARGFCTKETPFSVYPADFAAFLVSDFANIAKEIEEIPF